jgi:aspartate/methionine/tyrosine aminotransferase
MAEDMPFNLVKSIAETETPPISDSFSWLPPAGTKRRQILLSQAVPNYPPPQELQQHVAELSAEAGTSLSTAILGMPALRDALARHLNAAYGASLDRGNIAITAGGNQAFCLTIMAIASAGDNVIVPSPFFFNHDMWLGMQGIETRLLPCSADHGMLPDVAKASDLIDDRTRGIVLVSPNNPTGAIYPAEHIRAFFELCRQRGIALLIDETYKDFRGSGAAAHELFNEPGWQDTFVHLHSFSKSYALTGYRVGGLAGSPALIAQIEKLMDCVAICAPHISQEAALYALERLDTWRGDKADAMLVKQQALEEAFLNPSLD